MTKKCVYERRDADTCVCHECGRVYKTQLAPHMIHTYCGIKNGQTENRTLPPYRPPTGNPGTTLHKLLARIGIHANKSCGCRSMIRMMDQNGPDWCRSHIDEIACHMMKEARRREMPVVEYSRPVIKAFVWTAIKLAERHLRQHKDT